MTIDDLLAKVPESVRPVAAQYGPALLAMSSEELWAWVTLLIAGNTRAAFDAVLAKLSVADMLAEAQKNLDAWDKANAKNEANLALQREALMALLKALLVVALAAVGL